MNDEDLNKIKSIVQDVVVEELKPIKRTLLENTQKIDALTAEMAEVQQKTGATLDLVKAIHDHDQRDIKELKEHLGLPFTPSPFK